MSYLAAVATSDGKHIDTHFGHADVFLILQVNEEDGSFEEVEERSVRPACGGGREAFTDRSSGTSCGGGRPFSVSSGNGISRSDARISGGPVSLCAGSRMNEVAEQLKDVDFVLCAMSGPHAQEVLQRYDIAVLNVVMPIPEAVRKLNEFRKKYHRNVLLPV